MTTFNKYETFREHVKSGDVVFVVGDKDGFRPVQRLIMWATGSKYTHVGIAFWVQMDGSDVPRLMIVESQGGTRRRILNLSYYQNSSLDVMTPPGDWSEVSNLALERIGKAEYGYMDALWVGIRERLQITFNWNLPDFNFKGETCSEFVARIYGLKNMVVSPQALFRELLAGGQKIKLMYRV